MPKKKAPSNGGDPFEGKDGTTNNDDNDNHPRQRPRENTAGDRKTRRAGGVAVNSDGQSSVIGVAGNHNHRSSGHSSGQSSGRANVEEWFPSSATHGYGASDEVEDDPSGEEEWEVPTATVAVAAAASRPQRSNVNNANYSDAAYRKETQKHFKQSPNRFSLLADDDEEEDEEDASTDSNPSEDDSDEYETGDVSEESSLDADSTESEEEESGDDSSSCSSDMMTKKKKKKKTGSNSKRNGNGNQRSKKSKNAKGKAKKSKSKKEVKESGDDELVDTAPNPMEMAGSSYSSSDEESKNSSGEDRHTERYWDDWASGKANGAVGHIQTKKVETGNSAHRFQEVLNGDTKKTGDYSVRYLHDTRSHAQGASVSGTKDQLEALGHDAAPPDAANPSKSTWFGRFKRDLTRNKRRGEKTRPIFKTYNVGDKIPDGCRANNPIPNGVFPASRKNEVFTYNFYCPGFDATYDCLNLAPWCTEDDSSISDSSI